MFFALRNPSLQSTWLLQRSVTVCCPFCCFCVTPFSHIVRFVSLLLKRFLDNLHLVFSPRLLSASQLQSSFQSQLGVLLLSRQPSILVLLPCVDDFQYLCFSSSVQLLSSRHCSIRTSRPAVGTAFCSFDSPLLLAMLFCQFVPLSEILVDLLLVVVQLLRLGAPFRQSGVASFADFSSGCDTVSILCLLASPPPALLCGSLLLRGSPHAPPTPLQACATS